jgi:transposase
VFRKKQREMAPALWVPTGALPTSPANTFYDRLDRVLQEEGFGDQVRAFCAPFYNMDASKGGQPGIDPEVYFKMLMVGFFENLQSERAIAARCADSIAIRAFLKYELTERTPDHSSLTVIARRLSLEVYDEVFGLVLRVLRAKKLLRGQTLAIDTSVMEANASLRALKHRVTGENYRQYVKRLAKAAGVDTTDPRAVSTFDRKRKGRTTSNAEWQNPHDPDAKIGPDKKGVTRMSYKPEHVVDMESGAIVHADLNPGDQADGADLADRIAEVEERLNHGLSDPEQPNAPVEERVKCEELIADMGYFQPAELRALHEHGIRTVIPDPLPHRCLDRLTEEERCAVLGARRSAKSASGRALMKRRGELAERPFVHVLDQGGGRRATHRGRINILKRHLVRTACYNLSLLMRATLGLGTLKQTWAATSSLLAEFLRALALLSHLEIASGGVQTIREPILELLRQLAPAGDRRLRFIATSTGC